MKKSYDFSGWATKANLLCSDGRVIGKDAFKHLDGAKVPLVWNHNHKESNNILGNAILQHRDDGMYAYCTFNETESGINAKELVKHGDISSLSIYADRIKQTGINVIHGVIREVSLVLAGANPGAFIENIMSHGVQSDDDAIICSGEAISVKHFVDDDIVTEEPIVHDTIVLADESIEHADSKKPADDNSSEETVQDVFNTLTEKQKTVVYALVAEAMVGDSATDNNDNPEGGKDSMKHNIFDKQTEGDAPVISHSQMDACIKDAKKFGSMRESAIQHGITDVGFLFPDAQNVTQTPSFIQRDMGWVSKVMSGVHKTPFSRIKSVFADITEDDARAKGYIKGNLKKEEVFTLLKRSTSPTTVYKKQKMDRDDVVDITDFDVIVWLKAEMRMMLNEEIARAILIGDGRSGASDDKIKEDCIRPIYKDVDLFAVKKSFPLAANASDDDLAKAFIRTVVKSRKAYKGSGNPTCYTTEDVVTACLLLEDTTGRIIYDSIDKLATVLRVREIITPPVMENITRVDGVNTLTLQAIIVNLDDYNVGADKGGEVNLFDDFDIDYNAQKYLIETRFSGALTKPFSAIVVESTRPT